MGVCLYDHKNDGYFANWLNSLMKKRGVLKCDLARECHISHKTIYAQTNNNQKPKFTQLLTYCWYFHISDEEMREVWSKVCEQFNICEE